MGWGTKPHQVEKWIPRNGRLEYFDDLGHFIHIEQPKMVADMALEFLGAPA